jgi:hypothetical protein
VSFYNKIFWSVNTKTQIPHLLRQNVCSFWLFLFYCRTCGSEKKDFLESKFPTLCSNLANVTRYYECYKIKSKKRRSSLVGSRLAYSWNGQPFESWNLL